MVQLSDSVYNPGNNTSLMSCQKILSKSNLNTTNDVRDKQVHCDVINAVHCDTCTATAVS